MSRKKNLILSIVLLISAIGGGCNSKENDFNSPAFDVIHIPRRKRSDATRIRLKWKKCWGAGKLDKLNKLTEDDEDVGISCAAYNRNQPRCNICHVRFKFYTHYERHYEEEHKGIGLSPYICTLCSRGFAYRNKLNEHTRKRHSKDRTWRKKRLPLRCYACKEVFEDGAILEKHASEKHPGEKCLHCAKCGETFLRRAALITHVEDTHAAAGRFRCHYCLKKLPKSRDFHIHVDECRNNYLNARRGDHTKVTAETVNLEYRGELLPKHCRVCGKSFPAHSKYLQHHVENHPGVDAFTCAYCSEGMGTKRRLIRHINKTHADAVEIYKGGATREFRVLIFKCEHCEEEFMGANVYKDHGKRAHPGKKLFFCAHCDGGFVCKKNLDRHVRCKHTFDNKRDTVCQCGYAFGRKDEFKRHQQKCGKDNKPKFGQGTGVYFCNFCEGTFRMKADTFRKHTSDCLNYRKCHVCNKRFHKYRSDKLVEHVRRRHAFHAKIVPSDEFFEGIGPSDQSSKEIAKKEDTREGNSWPVLRIKEEENV